MVWSTHQAGTVWELAARQHGVVARGQLTLLGFSQRAVEHRVARGRLHRVARGVYAVGRAELTRHGRWTAAVLSCGADTALSGLSAAALYEFAAEGSLIEISTRSSSARHQPGVRVRRRPALTPDDLTTYERIPVTDPVCTLVDLAAVLPRLRLERAIDAADRAGIIDPEALRAALDRARGRPGVAQLRGTLDRRTFRLTRSPLERRFLPLAAQARLPPPLTGEVVGGVEVDFYWPELGLVVETDGLRYHRTPAQQSRDRVRDQLHTAAGRTPLRFTHEQVSDEPGGVRATLAAVRRRLATSGAGPPGKPAP